MRRHNNGIELVTRSRIDDSIYSIARECFNRNAEAALLDTTFQLVQIEP